MTFLYYAIALGLTISCTSLIRQVNDKAAARKARQNKTLDSTMEWMRRG